MTWSLVRLVDVIARGVHAFDLAALAVLGDVRLDEADLGAVLEGEYVQRCKFKQTFSFAG